MSFQRPVQRANGSYDLLAEFDAAIAEITATPFIGNPLPEQIAHTREWFGHVSADVGEVRDAHVARRIVQEAVNALASYTASVQAVQAMRGEGFSISDLLSAAREPRASALN